MPITPYKPTYIKQYEQGLIQNRQEFILPEDAFPNLENMWIFRERIQRRQGLQILGILQRNFDSISYFPSGASPWTFNILSNSGYISNADNANPGQVTTYNPHGLTNGDSVQISEVVGATGYNTNSPFTVTVVDDFNFTIGADASAYGAYTSGGFFISNTSSISGEPDASIVPGSVVIVIGAITFTDQGDGTLTSATPGNSGVINYATGSITLTTTAIALSAVTLTYSYYPHLPSMGIRTQESQSDVNINTIFFDTKYAYEWTGAEFQELPSTTPTIWTGQDFNFFFTTNYWVDVSNNNAKIFWATNFSGTSGDPIRYYDTVTWNDFTPQINAAADLLTQCLALLPFRGRLVVFNTLEGSSLNASLPFYQRIRWSAIGSPFTANSWRDDIPGQGGFLDIPTSENITAVGFVRDNLVVYCERSTWQLRYTGRSISPFQIERVNSELGSYSAFSAVQFDTSLVGIGDKGVVECDSYQSQRIDIKIPDLVFNFSGANNAPVRVQGIRDIQQRCAYWTYVYNPTSQDQSSEGSTSVYPNRRLVYNYENKSWAIFTDSLTSLGMFQQSESFTWDSADCTWDEANFPWNNIPDSFPSILGGNQQGYIMYLGSNFFPQVSNDETLFIQDITGNTTSPTVITSPNHNLVSNQVIQIIGLLPTDPFYSTLNDEIFGVQVTGTDTFQLWQYDALTDSFDTLPQLNSPGTYLGAGEICVRDGISVISKKFNFLEMGQNIQMGYMDLLMTATPEGAITMNLYLNYNDSQPVNTYPQNQRADTGLPDPFFNSVIPTSASQLGGIVGSKYMQRVFCPVRGAFITIELTLSNSQLVNIQQESDVQVDTMILWKREAGRLQSW